MSIDLKLFPNKEQWGTGDEALDSKLSVALIKSITPISFDSICEFYLFGMSLKTRTFNPTFFVNIELVTKALFYLFDPNQCIDHSVKKMKGNYYSKTKKKFQFQDQEFILSELKKTRKMRYKDQIDFSIQYQDPEERNPFLKNVLVRSKTDLNVKIIFKDFKNFLTSETKNEVYSDPFFLALQERNQILEIENFAEIWFHQDQIYGIANF